MPRTNRQSNVLQFRERSEPKAERYIDLNHQLVRDPEVTYFFSMKDGREWLIVERGLKPGKWDTVITETADGQYGVEPYEAECNQRVWGTARFRVTRERADYGEVLEA